MSSFPKGAGNAALNEATTTQPATARTIWRDKLFWFMLTLFFVGGLVFNVLPVGFPVFKQVFAATPEKLGLVQCAFFTGGVLFSVVGGWLIGRWGLRVAVTVALGLLTAALLIISEAPNFAAVTLGAGCFGFALFATVTAGNATINNHFQDKRQSTFFLMALVAASGGVLGPAVLGRWFAFAGLQDESWRIGYLAAGAIVAGLALWSFFFASTEFHRASGSLPNTGATNSAKEFLGKPVAYGLGLIYFLHGAAQGGIVSFVGLLYQKKLQADVDHAAYLITANAAGLTGGRLLLYWATSRWEISELWIMTGCAAGATLAFAGTIASPSYLLGLIVFFLAGAFVSAIGPAVTSYTGGRFRSQATTAFSLSVGIGSLGGASGAYLIGLVASRLGVEKGIWLVPAASVVLAGVLFRWAIVERPFELQSSGSAEK